MQHLLHVAEKSQQQDEFHQQNPYPFHEIERGLHDFIDHDPRLISEIYRNPWLQYRFYRSGDLKAQFDSLLFKKYADLVDFFDPHHLYMHQCIVKLSKDNAVHELTGCMDHAKARGCPNIAIAFEPGMHAFVIIADPVQNIIYTFDPMDYNRQEEPWSKYNQSGSTYVEAVLAKIKSETAPRHMSLQKYCLGFKCIQYYINVQTCTMYVIYFIAMCIWKQISSANLLQVMSKSVQSTYDFQNSFPENHTFKADDESTKLIRVIYTAFAINLTLSTLTYKFVQEAPDDEQKAIRIKNFLDAIDSANCYADQIKVSLISRATMSKFCGPHSVTQIDDLMGGRHSLKSADINATKY